MNKYVGRRILASVLVAGIYTVSLHPGDHEENPHVPEKEGAVDSPVFSPTIVVSGLTNSYWAF